MKNYYKNLKNIKAVNKYLEKINVEGFDLDEYLFQNGLDFELDYDGWQNEEKTEGISVQITPLYDGSIDVVVTKYTDRDIEKMEKEIA